MEDDDNFTTTNDDTQLDSLSNLGDFTASVGEVETDYTNLTKEDAASKLVSSSK